MLRPPGQSREVPREPEKVLPKPARIRLGREANCRPFPPPLRLSRAGRPAQDRCAATYFVETVANEYNPAL